MQRQASFLLVIALAVQASACGAGVVARQEPKPAAVVEPEHAASPVAEEPERFHCDVEVGALGAEVIGEAKSEGPGDLEEQAWHNVCEALRTQHHLDCERDRRSISVSRFQQVTVANGIMSQSVRFAVKPIVARVRASAAADPSPEDACRKAVEVACKTAPEGSTCNAIGIGCEVVDASHWRCSPDQRFRRIAAERPIFGE